MMEFQKNQKLRHTIAAVCAVSLGSLTASAAYAAGEGVMPG
ncbi:hypothetical protein [Cupriavidus metallidurans]|nr:hypothetical protein [Cupriavidus metallidurans]